MQSRYTGSDLYYQAMNTHPAVVRTGYSFLALAVNAILEAGDDRRLTHTAHYALRLQLESALGRVGETHLIDLLALLGTLPSVQDWEQEPK